MYEYHITFDMVTPPVKVPGYEAPQTIHWKTTGIHKQQNDPLGPTVVLKELEAAARRGGMKITITVNETANSIRQRVLLIPPTEE